MRRRETHSFKMVFALAVGIFSLILPSGSRCLHPEFRIFATPLQTHSEPSPPTPDAPGCPAAGPPEAPSAPGRSTPGPCAAASSGVPPGSAVPRSNRSYHAVGPFQDPPSAKGAACNHSAFQPTRNRGHPALHTRKLGGPTLVVIIADTQVFRSEIRSSGDSRLES